MTLDEPLDDLRTWLPRSAALISEPDTDGTAGHGKPGSRPPWNQSSANATWDAVAVIADVRALFAFLVHGRPGQAYPYAATGAALDAIGRLGEAVPQAYVRRAERDLSRAVLPMLRLNAIDEEETPQSLPEFRCPYCQIAMTRLLPKAGMVYCTRYGSCTDANGKTPKGWCRDGRFGQGEIQWDDGYVQ